MKHPESGQRWRLVAYPYAEVVVVAVKLSGVIVRKANGHRTFVSRSLFERDFVPIGES